MKKRKMNIFGIASVLLLSGFLLTTAPMSKASAISTTTNKDAWEYVGGWDINSTYIASGVQAAVKGADSVSNPWDYKALIPNSPNDTTLKNFFDLNLYESVEISFAVDMYDEGGNEQHMAVNGDGLFVDVLDLESWNVILHLKIWVNSGSPLNGDHSYELTLGDWSNKVNPFWIKGNATASSQFTIKFDLENHLQSYAGGQDGFVNLSGGNETIKSAVNAALANCNNKIKFAIYGDGGFKTTTNVVLKSINNQSLANSDGTFDDNVGPTFVKGADVTNETTFLPGVSYNTNDSLVAYDIINNGGNTYYKTSVDGGNTKVDGRAFKFTELGEKVVTLYAYDGAGNESSISKTVTVSAHNATTFAAWMNGEHTASCVDKYKEAKTYLLQMSPDEINNFINGTSEDIVAARERYEAWCRANNDINPYSGSLVSPSNLSAIKIEFSSSGIIGLAGIVFAVFVLLFVTLKVMKKKHQ